MFWCLYLLHRSPALCPPDRSTCRRLCSLSRPALSDLWLWACAGYALWRRRMCSGTPCCHSGHSGHSGRQDVLRHSLLSQRFCRCQCTQRCAAGAARASWPSRRAQRSSSTTRSWRPCMCWSRALGRQVCWRLCMWRSRASARMHARICVVIPCTVYICAGPERVV